MGKTKHTPGPWIGQDHAIYAADGRCLASLMHTYSEDTEANARLIATAPQLLHTVQLCLTLIESLQPVFAIIGKEQASQALEIHEAIRAVISKAEGGAE